MELNLAAPLNFENLDNVFSRECVLKIYGKFFMAVLIYVIEIITIAKMCV